MLNTRILDAIPLQQREIILSGISKNLSEQILVAVRLFLKYFDMQTTSKYGEKMTFLTSHFSYGAVLKHIRFRKVSGSERIASEQNIGKKLFPYYLRHLASY